MIPQILPHDQRNFVHKRLFGAVKGFVGGGFTGAARGFITGGGTSAPARRGGIFKSVPVRERKAQVFDPAILSLTQGHVAHGHTQRTPKHAFLTDARIEAASALPPPKRCIPPFFLNSATGRCELDLIPGPGGGGTGSRRDAPVGQAVAGAFGIPAMVPEAVPQTRLACPSGMVLGRDDLCYPKQVLRRDSKFRKHRPGVRPILTGGQRNAIRRAKAAITTARSAISGLGVTVKKAK